MGRVRRFVDSTVGRVITTTPMLRPAAAVGRRLPQDCLSESYGGHSLLILRARVDKQLPGDAKRCLAWSGPCGDAPLAERGRSGSGPRRNSCPGGRMCRRCSWVRRRYARSGSSCRCGTRRAGSICTPRGTSCVASLLLVAVSRSNARSEVKCCGRRSFRKMALGILTGSSFLSALPRCCVLADSHFKCKVRRRDAARVHDLIHDAQRWQRRPLTPMRVAHS